jgi:SAM-dependent methyltransferase
MLRHTIERLCAHGEIEPFQRLPLKQLSNVRWDDSALGARLLSVHLDGSTDQASRGANLRGAIERWITAVTGDLSGHEVLDLCCGTGSLTGLRRAWSYTGVDVNSVLVGAARELHGGGVNFVCSDILDYLSTGDISRASLVLVLYECLNALGTHTACVLLDLLHRRCSPGTWLIGDIRLCGVGAGRHWAKANECVYIAPLKADLVIDESGYTDDGVYFGHRYVAVAAGAPTVSIHSFIKLFPPVGLARLLERTGWQLRTSHQVLRGMRTDVPECIDNLFFAAIASAK